MLCLIAMSRRKVVKIVIISILICLGGVIFLISQIKLQKDRDRSITYAITSDKKEQIKVICGDSDSTTDLIKKCSELVCEQLSFTTKNNIQCGEANCVGYAQLTSATINYAFQIKNLPYKAKPVVGKVYLFGINLNNAAQKILPQRHRPFFKDHDFVEVNAGSEVIYVDASLQDIIGIRFIK